MSLPTLLRLPRELRDEIYHYYLINEDGYTYNFNTNKLVQANGTPINLSLAFTCRQIAHELDGLAFRTNTITFSTFFSEATRKEAGLFNIAIQEKQSEEFRRLRFFARTPLFSPDVAQAAREHYPMFSPVIEQWCRDRSAWIHQNRPLTYGEPRSLFASFVHFTLKNIRERPDFLERTKVPNGFMANMAQSALELLSDRPKLLSLIKPLADFFTTWSTTDDPALSYSSTQPWDILDGEELQSFIATFTTTQWKYDEHARYPYSAASQVIRFFRSLTKRSFLQVRNVILREDFESVAIPECHGVGLIPFCTENPNLRVERFVSLWQNAFPVRRYEYVEREASSRHVQNPWWLHNDKLRSSDITQSVGAWIVEADLLPSLGMPKDSYTLVLDGDPTPAKSSEAFEIVKRDAAWQAALDIGCARGSFPTPTWFERRLMPVGYHYEALPSVMQRLSRDSSLIRCNFDPGPPHSAQALFDAHSSWTLAQWVQEWFSHEPSSFETESPLPPWYQLRWHRVI
jgi:hypothetical protein